MRNEKASEHLSARTKCLALRIIRLVEALPNKPVANVIGRQLLRAGTSVGANYRAASRARSVAEFCSKLGIVEEEADEVAYWLELLSEAKLVPDHRLGDLRRETDEILAMTVSSIKTARAKTRSKTR